MSEIQEIQDLRIAKEQGLGATLRCYLKYSGPGFLQSAITLGGGSLAGALFLGVIGGFEMLWVQLFAMIMGATMLAAIAYVTLTTGSSPFKGIREHVNPALAWGWLIASMMANMVWVLPQYALSYSSLKDNLMPGVLAGADSTSTQFIIALLVLGFSIFLASFYGRGGKGIKIYETILKVLVAVVVLCFFGVVLKLTLMGELPWGQIFSGYIPSPGQYFYPTETYQLALDNIQNEAARTWWTDQVVSAQRSRMIAAASAAVGINMTFLLPFSILSRKWNKECRGMAIFDLGFGMVIPFVLATSCIVIASATMFNGQSYDGLLKDVGGKMVVDESREDLAPQRKALSSQLDSRKATVQAPLEQQEVILSAMLIKRDNKDFAQALSSLLGDKFSNWFFGIGVLAMTLSTISLLMTINGFCLCEALGHEHGGKTHRIGTYLAATGIFWPFLWSGTSKAYLAITTSVFGYVLLPIAFLTFFLMMNSKRLMGEDRPKGGARLIWNLLMGVSLLITGLAAGDTAWGKTMSIGDFTFHPGRWLIGIFVVAVVWGHFHIKAKHNASSEAETASA
jgi:Mn2+/Fe2+ NRAMP family transporter